MDGSPSVSRDEFEAHRRQVSADIAGLADAIKAEGAQRSRDTQVLRTDIKELSADSNRPPYQAMAFAFAVFSTVLMLFFGLYSFMDTKVEEATRVLAIERHESEEALSVARHKEQGAYLRGENLTQNERLVAIERHIFFPPKPETEL
jgi:hypothetical protein